jgi:hypothetical protein
MSNQKPTAEQRVIGEIEAQRNMAMSQLARLGAELMATRDALDDAVSERDALKDAAKATLPQDTEKD